MKVIKPGHRYELANLKTPGASTLQFYQDGRIHGETVDGPSTQEVLRACIERVQSLDAEKPWSRNEEITAHLRRAILLFEIRALERKVERGFAIERLPTGEDGHIQWREE